MKSAHAINPLMQTTDKPSRVQAKHDIQLILCRHCGYIGEIERVKLDDRRGQLDRQIVRCPACQSLNITEDRYEIEMAKLPVPFTDDSPITKGEARHAELEFYPDEI